MRVTYCLRASISQILFLFYLPIPSICQNNLSSRCKQLTGVSGMPLQRVQLSVFFMDSQSPLLPARLAFVLASPSLQKVRRTPGRLSLMVESRFHVSVVSYASLSRCARRHVHPIRSAQPDFPSVIGAMFEGRGASSARPTAVGPRLPPHLHI